MPHIFVSYSRKDVVYVEKLVNALRHEGFNPWIDVDELRAGTRWQERLHKQIKTCDAYVLILSRNSRVSRWVEDELTLAKNLNKPIFPLLLQDTELYLGIQTVQYEDVRGGTLPSEVFYERLATVSPRRRTARRKSSAIRLMDLSRQQKVNQAAEKASYLLSKFTSGVKDVIAVAAKVSSDTYKSLANSTAVKKASSGVKRKRKPEKNKQK